MGSPEATLAAAEGVEMPEGVFEELTGSLQGWKRKFSGKKGGTPKKKDVSFVTPDGEEIKNKRHLDKYLKAHPGTLTTSDFDWAIAAGDPLTPGETPRRSARLNSKGRSSTDGLDADAEAKQPVLKRSRKSRDNGKDKNHAVAGKDEIMHDAEKPEKKAGSEEGLDVPAKQLLEEEVENGEAEKEKSLSEENKAMDVDVPKVEAPAVEETKEVKAEKLAPKFEDIKEAVPVGDYVKEPLEETPKVPAIVEIAAEPEPVAEPETEEAVKQQDNVAMNEDEEKANGNELDIPVLKTKEERRGNGTWKVKPLRSGRDLHNLQPCSTSSSLWDPTDMTHVLAVKKALHLSAVPSSVLCREIEQKKVIGFCKASIVEQIPGSVYVCGCPGTGKSLTMEQVKSLCVAWATEANLPTPEVISVNCTTLTDPRSIYKKVLQSLKPSEANEVAQKPWSLCLKEIKQRVCDTSQRPGASPKGMLLMIVDEMDYLITRNQEVLYDLFRLATYPNSRCILIGISNAIDLTDRFLPKLRAMNCKPDVVTFPAYTKDQVLTVLTQRLKEVPFTVFHPPALELCARAYGESLPIVLLQKVAAASGDMRKALHVCRSALEILETEVKAEAEKEKNGKPLLEGSAPPGIRQRSSSNVLPDLVRIDHMAKALARTFRSPVVETIQNLPQHQQMVLCSAVRLFRRAKKDATLGELNKAYLDFCKASTMHALASSEFSSMCSVLADQALLELGTHREDRLRRVTLQVNQDDVVFALQGVRFFRNSLS